MINFHLLLSSINIQNSNETVKAKKARYIILAQRGGHLALLASQDHFPERYRAGQIDPLIKRP